MNNQPHVGPQALPGGRVAIPWPVEAELSPQEESVIANAPVAEGVDALDPEDFVAIRVPVVEVSLGVLEDGSVRIQTTIVVPAPCLAKPVSRLLRGVNTQTEGAKVLQETLPLTCTPLMPEVRLILPKGTIKPPPGRAEMLDQLLGGGVGESAEG